MFLWGHSQGGRNWNKFLSNEGESYVEIRRGLLTPNWSIFLCREHSMAMGGGYGSLNCDNSTIHSNDWSAAQSEAARRIDSVLPFDSAEEFLSEIFPKDEEIAARETIYVGSGWGALENRVREHCGQSPISHFVSFLKIPLGSRREWLELLEHETIGEHGENDPPASFITGSFWIDA